MEQLRIFILMFASANGLSLSTLLFMISAILRSKTARGQKFNLYLIFSVMPDVVKGILGFTCNVANLSSVMFNMWACTTIGWTEVFYSTSSYWMGAVVIHEVHKLLCETKACRRIQNEQPSTTRRVLFIKVAAVFTLATVMACIMLETSVDWIPDITLETNCVAFPRNAKESYYFWFAYVLPCMGVPTMYALYLSFDIYKKDLLPLTGKTRAIALYFFRLIAIFVTFWIVLVIAVFLKGWAQAIAFTINNLCGFFSFCFAITKPDVKEAIVSMTRCRVPGIWRKSQMPTAASNSTQTGGKISGDQSLALEEGAEEQVYEVAEKDADAPEGATSSEEGVTPAEDVAERLEEAA